LPDVFGPVKNLNICVYSLTVKRDLTDRFWRYQMWLKVSDVFPVKIRRSMVNKKLSFIYSEDAVSAVLAVIHSGSSTFGKVFNIAQVNIGMISFHV
jgi:hypothetical protein